MFSFIMAIMMANKVSRGLQLSPFEERPRLRPTFIPQPKHLNKVILDSIFKLSQHCHFSMRWQWRTQDWTLATGCAGKKKQPTNAKRLKGVDFASKRIIIVLVQCLCVSLSQRRK